MKAAQSTTSMLLVQMPMVFSDATKHDDTFNSDHLPVLLYLVEVVFKLLLLIHQVRITHFTGIIIVDALDNFFFRIHYKRAVGINGFI